MSFMGKSQNSKEIDALKRKFLVLAVLILLALTIATSVIASVEICNVKKQVGDELQEKLDAAESAYEDAKNAFLNAKNAYEGASEKYTEAAVLYENANATYTLAKADYGTAKEKYAEARLAYLSSVTKNENAESAYLEAKAAYVEAQTALNSAKESAIAATEAYNGATEKLLLAENEFGKAEDAYNLAAAIIDNSSAEPSEPTARVIYDKVIDSIYEIRAYDVDGTYIKLGSGFAISGDGKVVTNYHVINGAFELKAYYGQGDEDFYKINTVLGYDVGIDIAVLKMDVTGSTSFLAIATELPLVGDTVYAVGSNTGLMKTFTKGTVAFTDREIKGFDIAYLQYVGITHSGNSGCAVLNSEGEVVGIHQLGDADTGDNGLAIPISHLSDITLDKNETPIETVMNNGADMTKILKTATYKSGLRITGIDFNYYIEDSVIKIPAEIDGMRVLKLDWGNDSAQLLYVNHIILSEGIEELGARSFYYAEALLSVKLPSTLKLVNEEAFALCPSLYKIFIEDNPNYIVENNVLYNTSKTYIYKAGAVRSDEESAEYAPEFTMPACVVTVGTFAFFNAELNSLNFETNSSLQTIEVFAFRGVKGLKDLVLPNGLVELAAGAFLGALELESVSFPEGISIGERYASEGIYYYGAFYACEKLETVTFRGAVTVIGDSAFAGSALTSLTLPITENMGQFVFLSADNLTTLDLSAVTGTLGGHLAYSLYALENLILPATATNLPTSAFENCLKLSTVTLPATMKEIGESAFEGCTKLTEVTFNEGLEKIGDYAFRMCVSLSDAELPATLRNVGKYAFSYCNALTSVAVPEGIKRLNEGVFYNCKELIEVNLPSTINEIKGGVFHTCPKLILINMQAIELPPYVNVEMLSDDVNAELEIKVLNVGVYRADSAWRIFGDFLINA